MAVHGTRQYTAQSGSARNAAMQQGNAAKHDTPAPVPRPTEAHTSRSTRRSTDVLRALAKDCAWSQAMYNPIVHS
jgi:hypothetical protein